MVGGSAMAGYLGVITPENFDGAFGYGLGGFGVTTAEQPMDGAPDVQLLDAGDDSYLDSLGVITPEREMAGASDVQLLGEVPEVDLMGGFGASFQSH